MASSHCHRSVYYVCVAIFLGSLFCSSNPCVYNFANNKLSQLLQLYTKSYTIQRESSNFFLLIQYCTDYSGSLTFLYKCLEQLVTIYKTFCDIQMGSTTHLYTQLGIIDIFTVLKLPVHQHRMFSPFIWSYFDFFHQEICSFLLMDPIHIMLHLFLSISPLCCSLDTDSTQESNLFCTMTMYAAILMYSFLSFRFLCSFFEIFYTDNCVICK